jgi:hypothetical protein
MTQHEVVSKLLLQIKMEGEIDPIHFASIREKLRQAYAAGYDERRSLNNKRRIVAQFDENGKFIQSFSSKKKASRITGFSETTIWRSIAYERVIRGFSWKYIETTSPQSSQNIAPKLKEGEFDQSLF